MAEDALLAELQALRDRVVGITDTALASRDGLIITADTVDINPDNLAALAAASQGLAQRMAAEAGKGALREALTRGSGGCVAVYPVGMVALQNTVKHCPGAPVEVTVELDPAPHRLRFRIADRGPGFDAEAIEGNGGLQNMADRIGAVGGDVRVSSGPGTGTQVTGWVPVVPGTSAP